MRRGLNRRHRRAVLFFLFPPLLVVRSLLGLGGQILGLIGDRVDLLLGQPPISIRASGSITDKSSYDR
jgi:hypothetical protein